MKLSNLEIDLTFQLKIFFWGLMDSLSFHKTIPELVNNPTALSVFGKILGANAGLILGSVFLFHWGISPLLDVIGQNALDLQNKQHFDSLMWFAFRWLWLGPVCVLCYSCCLAWYNELGESLKKGKVEKSAHGKINEGLYSIYALIVWALAFVQLQILNNVVPMALNSVIAFVENAIAIDLLKQSLVHILRAVGAGNQVLNYLLMTTLYGWYAFDPTWIARGVNPDERFGRIHKYWAYFLGFGLPFTLLNKGTSFFIGFSTFLMVFPLSIILGSKLDYTLPYKRFDVKPFAFVEVFRPAQVWTLYMLRPFNKKRAAGG
ncbi:EI24 domain-containing protein, partial [archaeon]